MSDHIQCLNKLAIVLPSLDPDRKFDAVVQGLVEAGFAHIVIVDDGSDAAHQIHFEQAAQHPCCRVLHHGVNKGKGRALKTAFRCVLDEYPEVEGVVTIDGDGQHLLDDIIACGEKMLELGDAVVLGCTHYVFLKDMIRRMLPEHVVITEGSEGTARQLKRVLARNRLLKESGCIEKAAEQGRKLIQESCARFNSAEIQELFTSMIPENFR